MAQPIGFTPDYTASAVYAALTGYTLNSSEVSYVLNYAAQNGNNINGLLNGFYSTYYGAMPLTGTTGSVGAMVATNLGITAGTTAYTNAVNYVNAQLAGAAAGTQGQTLSSILSMFSTMTGDATYGQYATAWDATVANITAYAHNNAAAGSLTGISASQTPYTLTGAAQSIAGNNIAVTGSQLYSSDTISATGSNNTLTINDTTGKSATGLPSGVNVSGVQTFNLSSNGTLGSAAGVAAVAQVQTLTVNTTPAAATDTLTVSYGGNSIVVQTGSTIAVEAATIASAINTLANATIASASGGTVTVTARVAGTALPTITVGSFSAAADAVGFSNVTTTANVPAGAAAATYNVSSFTGLTTLNANSTGGAYINAASTTSVNETDSALGAGSIAITGANNVNVTSTDGTGTITIGTATTAQQPTGAVVINSTLTQAETGGLITVNGGTTVNVSQVVTDTNAADTVTQSAVTVNGGKNTTSVTVSQGSTATGAAATVANHGTLSVSATAAAPGVNGVTAVTGTAYVKSTAPSNATVVDGVVTITDVNGASNTAAGTITSVTLAGYGTGSTIVDNALATLNLSGAAFAGNTLTITDNLTAHTNGSTSLSLNTNTFSTTGTVVDAKLGTLTVTNSGKSSFGGVNATSLKTLNISGSGTLSQLVNSTLNTALTTLNISGSVGFSDQTTGGAAGLSTLGSALTINNTSSGTFTATIDDTTQTYNGSAAGASKLYLAGDATKAITGNGAASEVVLTNTTAATDYTLANFGTNVTGFGILGIAGSVNNGVIDMSQFNSGFKTIQIESTGSVAFSKVVAGTAINFDSSSATDSFAFSDANGATDTATVTIGSATNATALTVTSLALSDKNGVGINTVNIVSNDLTTSALGATTAGENIISTLIDANLGTLNVSGSGDLLITNFISDIASSITINDLTTGNIGLTIGTLTDNNLTSLSIGGSNATVISTLNDAAASLSISNNGTSTATIAAATLGSSGTAETLTLGSGVAVGANTALTGGISLSSTVGTTVSAANDNAHINLSLAAAGATYTNAVILGNGNNSVVDATVNGTVNVTVGSGANAIAFTGTALTNTSGQFNVTLGSHVNTASLYDVITVAGAGAGYATTFNNVITGAVKGDVIKFGLDANSSTTFTAVTAAADLATYTSNLISALGTTQHAVAYFDFGGNTYIGEQSGTAANGANITMIEIVGGASHTLSLAAGHVALAS